MAEIRSTATAVPLTASSLKEAGTENVQTKQQKEADLKLKKVCADFESIFTYNLLKTMRKTIPGGGVLPRSSGRENWEMLMDQQIAETISRKGQGLGLQTVLYDQMKKRLKVSE
jgi:flagellar protein FlgJ